MRKSNQMRALLIAGASAFALAGAVGSAFAAEEGATIEELVAKHEELERSGR